MTDDTSLDPWLAIPIVLVVLAVSYATCVTAGQAMCADTARDSCTSTGIEDYRMVCGAGYDLDGGFRLGFTCSYRCRR